MGLQSKIDEAQQRVTIAREQGDLSPLKAGPPEPIAEERPSLGYAIFQFCGSLVIGALAWVVIVALTLLSAVPFGGGSKELIGLLILATIGIPIWAAFPLAKTIYELATRNSKRK